MIDVLTVQEIELAVAESAGQREADFQAAFNAPVLRAQLVKDVLSDPVLAAELKRRDPDEHRRVIASIRHLQAALK